MKLIVFNSVDRILSFSEQRQLVDILSNGTEIVIKSIKQGMSAPLTPRAGVKAVALSERHRQILYLLQEGKTNPEIAAILQLSRKNVKYHIERLFEKLNVSNRTQAVARAIELNIALLLPDAL
ncbi:MAG TPA: helix-turn-helix transcriptional regulator [Burkholderiaceae bacterium]|jgi:DNA-binding NarL/FixJ family response regulator